MPLILNRGTNKRFYIALIRTQPEKTAPVLSGLLGLSMFTAEQRKREIGIRKEIFVSS